MAILESIANLLGMTSTQLIVVTVVILVLVVGWYILKTALKIASKIFAIGCFTIVLLVAGLYVYFAFFAG